MEEIKNLQGMRTVYDANDVDSLDDNNEEMLRGAGSSGSGSGSESGSEGSIPDANLPQYPLTEGSSIVSFTGAPSDTGVKISWGSGNFTIVSSPSVAASLEVANPNINVISSNISATWSRYYVVSVTGTVSYNCDKIIHYGDNTETMHSETIDINISITYNIPERYKKPSGNNNA